MFVVPANTTALSFGQSTRAQRQGCAWKPEEHGGWLNAAVLAALVGASAVWYFLRPLLACHHSRAGYLSAANLLIIALACACTKQQHKLDADPNHTYDVHALKTRPRRVPKRDRCAFKCSVLGRRVSWVLESGSMSSSASLQKSNQASCPAGLCRPSSPNSPKPVWTHARFFWRWRWRQEALPPLRVALRLKRADGLPRRQACAYQHVLVASAAVHSTRHRGVAYNTQVYSSIPCSRTVFRRPPQRETRVGVGTYVRGQQQCRLVFASQRTHKGAAA